MRKLTKDNFTWTSDNWPEIIDQRQLTKDIGNWPKIIFTWNSDNGTWAKNCCPQEPIYSCFTFLLRVISSSKLYLINYWTNRSKCTNKLNFDWFLLSWYSCTWCWSWSSDSHCDNSNNCANNLAKTSKKVRISITQQS